MVRLTAHYRTQLSKVLLKFRNVIRSDMKSAAHFEYFTQYRHNKTATVMYLLYVILVHV